MQTLLDTPVVLSLRGLLVCNFCCLLQQGDWLPQRHFCFASPAPFIFTMHGAAFCLSDLGIPDAADAAP